MPGGTRAVGGRCSYAGGGAPTHLRAEQRPRSGSEQEAGYIRWLGRRGRSKKVRIAAQRLECGCVARVWRRRDVIGGGRQVV